MEHGCAYDALGCLSWLCVLIALVSVLAFIVGIIAVFVPSLSGDNTGFLLILGGFFGAIGFGVLAQWLGKQGDKLRKVTGQAPFMKR